jgi:hypothetical protein
MIVDYVAFRKDGGCDSRIPTAVMRWTQLAQWGRRMWLGKWLCALVAMSCNSVPDIAGIQSAYELEALAGSTLHDRGLQILQTKCHDDGADTFTCELRFISKGDPERPYFDIVSVARAGESWVLKSGLCKGPVHIPASATR